MSKCGRTTFPQSSFVASSPQSPPRGRGIAPFAREPPRDTREWSLIGEAEGLVCYRKNRSHGGWENL